MTAVVSTQCLGPRSPLPTNFSKTALMPADAWSNAHLTMHFTLFERAEFSTNFASTVKVNVSLRSVCVPSVFSQTNSSLVKAAFSCV
jgi:hypothetical protein